MADMPGLRRFLELVPEFPVAEAQRQARMTDEELDELVNLATAILDDERRDSVYDLSVLKGQQRMEQRMISSMVEMVHELRRLQRGFVDVCRVLDQLVEWANEKYNTSSEPRVSATVLPFPRAVPMSPEGSSAGEDQ